jgi:hypothetical protein
MIELLVAREKAREIIGKQREFPAGRQGFPACFPINRADRETASALNALGDLFFPLLFIHGAFG